MIDIKLLRQDTDAFIRAAQLKNCPVDIPALLDTVQELRELLAEAEPKVDCHLDDLRLRVAGGEYAGRHEITVDRKKHVKQVEELHKRIKEALE